MGLKQDIVVVNEFSVPKPGGKGSRGSTPGSYVTRYMAREQATESLAPIQRLRTDDFILRYMARESAVERASTMQTPSPSSRSRAKREMRQAQGNGGVAFGYGTVSLSDEQLKSASADLQRLFDQGHTVLKTVLSFDEAYLKRHGIVGPDFTCENRGDYRGHLDQMKLRMAIMHGLDRMARGSGGFDELRYVGVIQVDTEHVHAHLAMVDAGQGRRAADGTQKGKLIDKHKSRLRRGVDSWLDEKQAVTQLSSAVGYERRNVTTFIKRWAHEKIRNESLPQFLLACLPPDRDLWRAGSHDRRMLKANRLVTDLVAEQLDRPGSPMPAALERITEYADQRRAVEGLSTEDWQKLVDNGRRQVLERATNSVYQMLRALPQDELRVRTPMLEVMSMDYQQMAMLAAQRQEGAPEEEDLVSFGFRLRSYSSRLAHHKEKAGVYRDLKRQWEKADEAAVAAYDSRPLYEFYRNEEDYHRRLMSKYQHFLPLIVDKSQWYDRQQEVAAYGQRLLSLRALRADASLQRMKDEAEAERLGRQIYDQPGGGLLTRGKDGRAVLDSRLRRMVEAYDERLEELRADLGGVGLVLTADQTQPLDQDADQQVASVIGSQIVTGTQHNFDEVKSLDLHHLGYDFTRDVELGPRSVAIFGQAAGRRRLLLRAAMDYLDATGQSVAIGDLPVEDVATMSRLATDLDQQQAELPPDGVVVLPSRIAQLHDEQALEPRRLLGTSSLDSELVLRVQAEVDDVAGEVAQVGPWVDRFDGLDRNSRETAGFDRSL